MKKKAIVIDDGDNADSIMDDGCRRFMVNAVNEHTSSKTYRINGPLICLDDDDDDDGDDQIKIDEKYKVFLDHLRDDNKLGPLFEYGNAVSDTRKFEIFSSDSKRSSKLENENPMDKRVPFQQRKKENNWFKGETSRVSFQQRKKENNWFKGETSRVSFQQRKKENDWFKGETSRVSFQQRKKENDDGFKGATWRVLKRQDIERDNRIAERRKRRINAELEEAHHRTSKKAVPFVKSQQVNKVGNISDETSRRKNDKETERRKSKTDDELKAQTLRRAVPLVRAVKDIERDKRIAERRGVKRKMSEPTPVERVKRVTELKDVDETSRKKNDKETSVVVVDKDYMRLVDSLKASTTKPMANVHKDLSDLGGKESTMATPGKEDLPVKVKVEQDLESWSDDSDIIAVSDSPFLDGEGTPFVVSKKVVDLDEVSKEGESRSFWFRKELMDVLKKPYNERELKQLHYEASIHRKMTRSRELRKGRETDYETDVLGLSYLDRFTDFEKEYKAVDGADKARALKLLRGFFFYLKNVSHDGAFKPWKKNQWWQP